MTMVASVLLTLTRGMGTEKRANECLTAMGPTVGNLVWPAVEDGQIWLVGKPAWPAKWLAIRLARLLECIFSSK